MPMRFAPLFSGVCLAFALVFTVPAAAQDADDPFARFGQHGPDGRSIVEYDILTEILEAIVLDVGPSDRFVPRGRIVETGSRITGENTSRYRTEANRVIFHLLEPFHKQALSDYRAELAELPNQIDFYSLNKNDQLAYWFNLHNVIVLDELAKAYPVRNVDLLRIGPDRETLHEATVVEIDGVPLSLQDIRTQIVARHWDQPIVMYGFFSGAIGGPGLRDEAFEGDSVYWLLDKSAREFVNALRGVENSASPVRVSPYYEEMQALFPSWPADLLSHLDQYAEDSVSDLVSAAERVAFLQYDWNIADMTNGSSGCGGAGARVERQGARNNIGGTCVALPPQALRLVVEIQQRRLRLLDQGRLGRVRVRDIPTDDQGNIIMDEIDGEELITIPAGGDDEGR